MEQAGNYGISICDRQGYILIKVDAADPKKFCFTNSLFLQLIFTDSQDVSEDVKASAIQSGLADTASQSISVFDMNGSCLTSESTIDPGSVCDAVQGTKEHLVGLLKFQTEQDGCRTKYQSTQTVLTDQSSLNSDNHKGKQHRKQKVIATEGKDLTKQHTEQLKNICLKCHVSFKTASALREHSRSPCSEKTLVVVLSRIDSHFSLLTKDQVLEVKPSHEKVEESSVANSHNKMTEFDEDYNGNEKEGPQTDSETKEEHFCKYCKKTFKNVDNFKEHLVISGEQCHNCEICGSRHNTKASLMVHQYINHPGVFTDKQTNERLAESQVGGSGNARESPQKVGQIGCFLCETVFRSVENLQNHMRMHTGELNYKCCVCGQKFPRMCDLRKHCKEKHLDINLRFSGFKCSLCDVKFPTWHDISSHHKEGQCSCPQCGKKMGTYEKTACLASKHNSQILECSYCKRFIKKRWRRCVIKDKQQNDVKEKETPETDSSTQGECFCKYCKKSFKSVDKFREHRSSVVSNEGQFHNCEICASWHNTKASLLVHQYINHPGLVTELQSNEASAESQAAGSGNVKESPQRVGQVGCFICKKVLRSSSLHSHMKIHTGEFKYQCCVCGRKFPRLSELKCHCDGEHLDINLRYQTFRCHLCNVKFSSMDALRKHQIGHPVTCNFCGEEQETWKQRAAHLASKHSDQAPQCAQCNRFFNSTYDLKHHKLHLHKDKKQCSICGALLPRYKLRAHMDSYHRGKHLFCDQCPMTFSQSKALKIHLRIHTGEKPFKCKVCSRAFRSSSSLYLHKAVHIKEKPFQCEICGKRCSHNYQLKAHMRRHSVKIYNCQVCGKGFKSKYSLPKHMKSMHADGSQERKSKHAGEIQDITYICHICEKVFRYKGFFQRHLKSKHGSKDIVYQYTCQLCKEGFSFSGGLQNHMRTQHADGSQDFTNSCKFCERAFTYKGGLQRHMKLKHAEESQEISTTVEPIYSEHSCNENPVISGIISVPVSPSSLL